MRCIKFERQPTSGSQLYVLMLHHSHALRDDRSMQATHADHVEQEERTLTPPLTCPFLGGELYLPLKSYPADGQL